MESPKLNSGNYFKFFKNEIHQSDTELSNELGNK